VTRGLLLAGLIALMAAAPSSAKTRRCPMNTAEKVTATGTTCADALAVIHDYHAHEPTCRPLGVVRSKCTVRGSRHRYRCKVVYTDSVHKVSCVSLPRTRRSARVRFTDIIGDEGRYP
jgi:hypothetical protein